MPGWFTEVSSHDNASYESGKGLRTHTLYNDLQKNRKICQDERQRSSADRSTGIGEFATKNDTVRQELEHVKDERQKNPAGLVTRACVRDERLDSETLRGMSDNAERRSKEIRDVVKDERQRCTSLERD